VHQVDLLEVLIAEACAVDSDAHVHHAVRKETDHSKELSDASSVTRGAKAQCVSRLVPIRMHVRPDRWTILVGSNSTCSSLG